MPALAVLDVVPDGVRGRGPYAPVKVAVRPERVAPQLHLHPLPELVPDPVRRRAP